MRPAVSRMRVISNAYILFGTPKERSCLLSLGMDLTRAVCESVDWVNVAHDSVQWLTSLKAVDHAVPLVSIKGGVIFDQLSDWGCQEGFCSFELLTSRTAVLLISCAPLVILKDCSCVKFLILYYSYLRLQLCQVSCAQLLSSNKS
jgi:hypothetical protein